MKRSKFGGFVILGTAIAAVANSSVSVNALGVKDFLKFFSWSNFKSFFNCVCSFIAERAGKNIAGDRNDSQTIHVWDKNGDLGLPAFDGDEEEEFVLGGITLVPEERKVLQDCRDGGSYHGWVVESQIDPGKILFIHPKGDLKDLGSGRNRFYVSEYWGPVPKVEDMTEEEKRQKQLEENKKIAEAEQSTPELDRELLKKHAPELYKFLEDKGTKREVASSLENVGGAQDN